MGPHDSTGCICHSLLIFGLSNQSLNQSINFIYARIVSANIFEPTTSITNYNKRKKIIASHLFLTGTLCHVTRKNENSEQSGAFWSCYNIFRGHRCAWFQLLTACCFKEFDTSVIYNVLILRFHLFLLQDMTISTGSQVTKINIFHANILLICILCCDARLGYSDWNCLQAQCVVS